MPSLSGILRKSKKAEKDSQADTATSKAYLKAMPLRDLSDLEAVKNEVKSGNILILRVTDLANKNLDDVRQAVSELCSFAESVGGDIARLGEERVVVCPQNVKIWRGKATTSTDPIPTAA